MLAAVQLTEGEQNRLIQSHMDMVAPIAAKYRGRKGIPFEELVSEGTAALVTAARGWRGEAQFTTYAHKYIDREVFKFIDNWQEMVSPESDDALEDRVHEWAIWGTIPAEGWNTLPASPEQIADVYEGIKANEAGIKAALISLSKRERNMVEAHFLRTPAVKLEQLARDHKVSYFRAVEIIYSAVRKMRDVIARMKENQSGVIRTGRSAVASRVRDYSSKNVIPFDRPTRAAH